MKQSFIALMLCAATVTAAVNSIASETAKPAAPQGDAARGQAIASTVCGACHGPDGNSTIAANPKLAGQHADYLLKQMKNFKGAEGKPAERTNAVMNGMIAAFNDDQMRDIAAYFAKQKQTGGTAKNVASVEYGQKLYRAGDLEKGLPACAGCHGPAGSGMPAQYPRLAGQFAEYTEAQLKAFRANERANDPNKMMRMVAIKMTDVEIKAVSDYIAGLH